MPYTHTRTAASFTAAEGAPSAEAAHAGDAILNEDASLRMTLLPNQAAGRVALNMATEPPTLTLQEARCRVTPGYPTDDGAFHVFPKVGSDLSTVSGSYTGPGSILEIISR